MSWVLLVDDWASTEFAVHTEEGLLAFIQWFYTDAPGSRYFLSAAAEEKSWANTPWPSASDNTSFPITRLMHVIWQRRPDLRSSFDLNSQQGRESFIRWFLLAGKEEYKLSAELVPDWLSQQVAGGGAGAVKQMVARGLKAGLRLFSGGAATEDPPVPSFYPAGHRFACVKSWQAYTPADRSGPYVANLFGALSGALGVGQHARLAASALAAANAKIFPADIVLPGRTETESKESCESTISDYPAGINLLCANPDWFFLLPQNDCVSIMRDRYNILNSFWELNLMPEPWIRKSDLIDEIWAPTKYIEESWKRATSKKVVHMPVPVELEPFTELSRAEFNLPGDQFLFFFNFDSVSFIRRKNPLAVLKAFKLAFPTGAEKAGLVIKTFNIAACESREHGDELAEIAQLKEMAKADSRIRLVSEYFPRNKLLAMTNVCDAYISLHRSEGFGFGMAESMLLGKPVIATNYSGNVDFTRPDNSCLVDYTLIPVGKGEYPYYRAGQVWAEPDVEQAAWYMRQLFENADYCQKIGRAGEEFVKQNHSFQVLGSVYARRLAEIARTLSGEGLQHNAFRNLRGITGSETAAVCVATNMKD